MGKKTKLEVKEEYRRKYGQKPRAYAGYADEPREQEVVRIIEKVAKPLGIYPSFLFTIAVGEGLGWLYLDLPSSFDKNNKLITDEKINAFQTLGMDFFGSPLEYPRFEKYLPKDFNEGDEYEVFMAERDEKYGKEIVPSAIFKDLESAIEGIGAVLAHRIELFEKKYKHLGYPKPTDDEKAYWYYAFYQAENDAERALAANKNFDFLNHQAAQSQQVHQLALERVASWRYLLAFNIFTS